MPVLGRLLSNLNPKRQLLFCKVMGKLTTNMTLKFSHSGSSSPGIGKW
ncbi:hypothetical protein LINPERPRIM_LOCUS26341 [Linum perenne]